VGVKTRPTLHELEAAEYLRLLPLLQSVGMNTLFARAVLVRDAPGRVLVDSVESPSVVYIQHGYGMSLLLRTRECPRPNADYLEKVLRLRRVAPEWLQVWPRAWASVLAASEVCRARGSAEVELHTRVNFQFFSQKYFASAARRSISGCTVARAERSAFSMAGTVVPRSFWSDADRFLDAGGGFAVLVDGRPAALAFSAFVTSSQLEIGVETAEEHRGRGLARLACAALIDQCLAKGLDPVWACRLDNRASHRLAEALGFVPIRHLPYFRLPPEAVGIRGAGHGANPWEEASSP